MPRYRVLKSHVHAPGGNYANEGDIIDLSKEEGVHRLAIGFVEGPVLDPPPSPVAIEDEATMSGKGKK